MTARFQDWVTESWLKKRNQEEEESIYTHAHVNALGEGRWMKIKLSQLVMKGTETLEDIGFILPPQYFRWNSSFGQLQ